MSTWKQLDALTGGLSKPSKMPCHGWSISAEKCSVGGVLRGVPGSTCSGCYARKGRYVFDNVKAAHARRLAAYNADPSAWADAMAESIKKKGETYFRWFDAGDLQSVEMLQHIVDIAAALPGVRFWLPTQERGIVGRFLATGDIPENLVIRISAPMVGAALPLPEALRQSPQVVRSAVSCGDGRACPAPQNAGECGECRACWNTGVDLVSYAKH